MGKDVNGLWAKALRTLTQAVAAIDPTSVAGASVAGASVAQPVVAQQRDVSLHNVMMAIHRAVDGMDVPEENIWHFVQDVYFADNSMYVVVIESGRLYRARVFVNGSDILLGDMQQVEVMFEPVQRMQIRQREDGRYEGFAILCTATVNKMGIVDSRGLFDSFVERFEGEGVEYVNVLHLGGSVSRIGEIRGIFRNDQALVGYLVFDESLMAQAAARTLAEDVDGVWGGSIEFEHYGEPTLVEFGDGISLPVTTDGKLLGYSIARAVDGAAWYTGNFIHKRIFMKPGDRDYETALALAGGDEEAVRELAENLEGVRTKLEGSIMYTVDGPGSQTEAETPVAETAVAAQLVAEAQSEIRESEDGNGELGDGSDDGADDARLAALEAEVAALKAAVVESGEQVRGLSKRISDSVADMGRMFGSRPEVAQVKAMIEERLNPVGEKVDGSVSGLEGVNVAITGINERLSQLGYKVEKDQQQVIDEHEANLPPQPDARQVERPRHQVKREGFVESDIARRMRERREGA